MAPHLVRLLSLSFAFLLATEQASGRLRHRDAPQASDTPLPHASDREMTKEERLQSGYDAINSLQSRDAGISQNAAFSAESDLASVSA